MQNKELPDWAKCPITNKLMLDPVLAADGRTYERAAIERLIAENPQGPVLATGSHSALKHSFLIDDTKKQEAIIDWVKKQPLKDQQKYEQDRSAQLRLRKNHDVEARTNSGSFFEQLPRDLIYQIIGRDLNLLTLSECKNLAQARIPRVSKYFQVAIQAANQNVRTFLDHVRGDRNAKANQMLAEDPALLTLKDVKISKLFLHMLRDKTYEVDWMRSEDPDLLPDEELKISQFLVHVSTENLEEAQKILEEDPSLLFKKGRLVDFGLRCFTEASKKGEAKGIYPLQYVDAAEDENGPMQRLLRRNCPNERKAELEKQLEESRSEKDNKLYRALENARHSLVAMRDAMVEFAKIIETVDTDAKYKAKEKEVEAAWRVVVEKQLELVSCWIHLWTEKGEKVAWHDASEGGVRECMSMDHKNIIWWYHHVGEYEDQGKYRVGAGRGLEIYACMGTGSWGPIWSVLDAEMCVRDAQKLSQLSATTQAAVPKDSSDDSPPACNIR